VDYTKFNGMPDDARLWVYGFDRGMTPETHALVEAELRAFTSTWSSHNAPVKSAFQIVEGRFVLLAGHCDSGLGGCAIDESVGLVRSFQERFGLDGLNRDLVFYRGHDESVQTSTRAQFQKLFDEGRVGVGTVVFDVALTRLADLRAGAFETTFDNCWHAQAFATR
jgi:hypothetical protein